MSKKYTVKIKLGNYDLSSLALLSTLEPLFERDYYELTSWNSESDGSGDPLVSPIDVQDDMTAYALWKPIDYSITYELCGGTNDSHNPATYNIESDTIELCNATKFQHVFDMWTENGSLVTAITTGSHGNKTLSAHYTRTKVTASYYANYRKYITMYAPDGALINYKIEELSNSSVPAHVLSFNGKEPYASNSHLSGNRIAAIYDDYNNENGFTKIASNSFNYNNTVTSLYLPNIKNVEILAINSCPNLKEITFGKDLTGSWNDRTSDNGGSTCINGNKSLFAIHIPNENNKYASIANDSIVVSKDLSTMYWGSYAVLTGNVVIPNEVTCIETNAIRSNFTLTIIEGNIQTLDLNNVKVLYHAVFHGQKHITSISAHNLTEMHSYCFSNCGTFDLHMENITAVPTIKSDQYPYSYSMVFEGDYVTMYVPNSLLAEFNRQITKYNTSAYKLTIIGV